MASFVFNRGALGLLAGTIVHASDTIKARLVLTSETLNRDSTVMTGIGLSATDVTISGKTGPVEDTANDRIEFDCGDITFTAVAVGAEVNRIVFYKFVTNDADSIPIAVNDITAVTPNGGDIIVSISADGTFYTQQ